MPVLAYDTSSLDLRIEMRAELAALRQDPTVQTVALLRRAPNEDEYEVTLRGEASREAIQVIFRRERPEPPPPTRERLELTESLIRESLSSQSGRQRLAQSMIAPLRARLDYSSVARQTFMVEALPLFEMSGPTPTINISEIRERRFDLIDRTPLAPVPEWCVAGAWIQRGWYVVQVLEVGRNIQAKPWRSCNTLTIPRPDLSEWAPTVEPVEVSRFDREDVV